MRVLSRCVQAIEAAATLYDDYCRVITPENLLTEESEEVSWGWCTRWLPPQALTSPFKAP